MSYPDAPPTLPSPQRGKGGEKGRPQSGFLSLEKLPRLAVLAGPAGIGKTQYFLENFSRLLQDSKNPFERDLLYLLPSAEHRERITDLILRKEMKGFAGDRVLTFDRLMQELLRAGDWALVTDAERKFLLEGILPEKSGEYFDGVRDLPGFLEKMSEFLGELKDSLVDLEAFRKRARALAKARPELAAKYEALLAVYEAYEKRLESMGAKDRRDGPFLLKETEGARRTTPRPKFRHLFIDGFFDFSRSQIEFLTWLTRSSERVTLALTVDPVSSRHGLFEIPLKTLKELEKIGFATIDCSEAPNHRVLSEGLRYVERNVFREKFNIHEDGETPPLKILEATGARGEVEMIAREIRRLIRTDGPAGRPYNYSDIAVIFRRIGPYEGLIRTVFRQFRVPVEVHEREKLGDSPLARTLVSFFRVLLDDWKREDLFNFLKSSYVERDYHEVCGLELRGLARGVLSGRENWLKELPHPLFEKLDFFQKNTSGERTAEDWARFTREALTAFGLGRIRPVYEERERRDFATLRRLDSLLEEIRRSSASWAGPLKSFPEFSREFLGLIEVDLYSLHDRDKNCVQVYDISLARQKEYQAVFLAGLLEKQFPAEIREDPILSDKERRIAGLPERLPRQAIERYFFYLGLTRARSRVFLSYPRFDLEGHEALPSFYVDEVRNLFLKDALPELRYPVSQALPRMEDAVEEREVEALLVRELYDLAPAQNRQRRALVLGLYNRFLAKPSFQALLPRVLFVPVARILDENVRKEFLPRGGIFKPTGLETYGRCPYRYFSSQVLRLEEREEGIDVMKVGKLLHKVLEDYWTERVEKGNQDLARPENARAFAVRRLGELLKEDPLTGDKPYRVALRTAEMESWLTHLLESEVAEGSPHEPFRPRFFERKFGFAPKNDYLELHDPYREPLKLRGQVDRIDVDPSGRYGLVMDYKTGGTFKFQHLAFGTSLQLPLYLLALQQIFKLKPAAGEIYQIKKAKTSGFYLREALEAGGAEVPSRSRTVFDRKEFDRILERAVRFSRRYAEGITRAEIPVRPRDCDDRCPFPSVCRIEKWRLKFIEQELREEDQKNGIV